MVTAEFKVVFDIGRAVECLLVGCGNYLWCTVVMELKKDSDKPSLADTLFRAVFLKICCGHVWSLYHA